MTDTASHIIIPIGRADKASLMDKVVTGLGGMHPMQIVGVGNYCPAEDTVYLHLSSTTKFTKTKNGKNPVQFCGWYYRPWIIEGSYAA